MCQNKSFESVARYDESFRTRIKMTVFRVFPGHDRQPQGAAPAIPDSGMAGLSRLIRPPVSRAPESSTAARTSLPDRKSVVEGRRLSVSLDRGGRRIINKKNKDKQD